MYKNFLTKILLWIIVPIILLFVWFGGALFASPYGGFTTLVYPHTSNEYTFLPKNNILLRGEKLVGKFKAEDNDLGIVALQVSRSLAAQPDQALYLKFHIREVGAKSWYYENTYNIGSLREDQFIVFGFPKITNSKDKIYVFELLSLNGDNTSAVSVIQGYDSFVTRYIYSRKEIAEHKLYIAMPYRKILSVIMYPKVLLSSSIFLLPLVYYLLFIFLYSSAHIAIILSRFFGHTPDSGPSGKQGSNQFVKHHLRKSLLGSLTITLILVDLFLIQSIYYGIALGLLGFWIIAVTKDKISWKISLLLSFIFLLISELDIAFKLIPQEDKSAMWVYFFLSIAVFQIIYRGRK